MTVLHCLAFPTIRNWWSTFADSCMMYCYVCLQVNRSYGNTRSAWRLEGFSTSSSLLWFGQSPWPVQQRWMTHKKVTLFLFFIICVLNIFVFKKPYRFLFPPESLGLWGFQGDSPSPSWVSLQSGEGEDVLELQERYIPLNLEVYGCLPPTAHARKDLELLRKSTGLQ